MLTFNAESIPAMIFELSENAINAIFNENYETAIELLQKASALIQRTGAGSEPRNAATLLLVHHNLALCYQK